MNNAFLFHTRYQFKKWNILKVTAHNATFYLPFSECYPFAYKPYLPYGTNDLDAVVNANILTTLQMMDDTASAGFKPAIKYLNKKCSVKKFDRVASYYPNRYQFAFSFANAYYAGVNELNISKEILTNYLLTKQKKDGSWSSRRAINKGDVIQSTAYAINALLCLNYKDLSMYRTQIEAGIKYLLQKSIAHENQCHWEGGVLFSGGTVVRTGLYWKSDAYTTALVAHALVLYQKYVLRKKPPLE